MRCISIHVRVASSLMRTVKKVSFGTKPTPTPESHANYGFASMGDVPTQAERR